MQRGRHLTLGLAGTGTALLILVPGMTLASVPSAQAAKIGLLPLLAVASMDLLPLAFIGGLLLVWAAARAASHLLPVCVGLCTGAASTVGGIAGSWVVPAQALRLAGVLVIVWWIGVLLATAAGVSLVVTLLQPDASVPATSR